ncbi:MAG: hypothetical protein KF856_10880 [Cyclobacteriaceae bacterium]|nr:hypothetical protein [Cyclobacteriaceae bacterium]
MSFALLKGLMKQIILLSMLVGLAFQTFSQDNPKIMSKESVTCKLTTHELQERKKTVIADVKKLVVQRVEVTNGVRYSFYDSDNTIDLLTNFIKTERLCCSFFEFNLVVGQFEGLVTLELSGPEGTKDFIESEIGF